MKKSILALAVVLGATTTFAQDLATNKNGKVYLPEAGDWSISINASPFINFASDLLHIGQAKTVDAPGFAALQDSTWSLSGKYFVSNEMAYRGSLRLYSDNSKTSTAQDWVSPVPANNWPNNVATKYDNYDVEKVKDWSVGIGGGVEYRKGTNRLQGYYGGEAILAFARTSKSYTYAIDLMVQDADAATPDYLTNYTTDFGGNISNTPGEYVTRTLSNKQSMTTAFGVRGFVGVEYFVFPKISLGGEFGWGLGISRTGASKQVVEGLDYLADDGTTAITAGEVVNDLEMPDDSKSVNFFIGSDRKFNGASENRLWMNSFSPQGQLSLNFYF